MFDFKKITHVKLKILIRLLIILIFIPTLVFSQTTIVCDPPRGLRVDYFEMNNILKKPANIFLPDTDKVSGMNPTIIFEDGEKFAMFILGHTKNAPKETLKTKMFIFYNSPEQISFVGLMKDAPILASYYPLLHILVYSQQANWLPVSGGMRATLFYSDCHKK
jgi:hypothetical protein